MIRDAHESDAKACAAIYAPYVTETAVSFESEPPTAEQMVGRMQRAHAWLVLVEGDKVLGYAYGDEFKSRPAYAWSCEVSVYLDRPVGGKATGVGCTRRCSRASLSGATAP